MHMSRAVLRSSVLRSCFLIATCLAGALFASRVSWTTIAHAEDRTTLAFARQQNSSATPTLKVYSRETIVDVTVTDKDGKPVHGLTRDDFTVKEDGKEQPIRSFEEFGTAVTPPQVPPKLPPHVYTNLQPTVPDGPINIILLDAVSTAPDTGLIFKPEISGPLTISQAFWMQHNLKEEAKKYLRSMPAGARATVLGVSSPGNLRVLQGPTTDSELLTAAVDSLEPVTDVLGLGMKAQMTLEALGQVAAAAAQIKGRKNLIWFAYGYDLTGLGGVTPSCPGVYPELRVHQVFSALAAAQVTVYPIGSGGVYAAFHARACDDLSLEAIAEEGGGVAYYNSNDLAGLVAKAVTAGSDYYTLSYVTPGSDYDGRHHGIHVDVDKPGIKLTYRDEYYAEDPRAITPKAGLTLAASSSDPAKPVDMRMEMGRSMPTSRGLLFDVQVQPSNEAARADDPAVFGVLNVKLKGKPLARYGFTYAFPGREIALKPAADGKQHGALEFDLAAYDGDGNVVTSLRQAIDLNLTAEQAEQLAHSPFRYFQQLDLPAGALFVRVGVLDRTGNKVGTLELPVTVAKTPQPTAQNTGAR